MKTLYLISLDNGESYEDHHRDPVCIVPDQQAAAAEITRLKSWVTRHQKGVPVQPDDSWPEERDSEAVGAYDCVMARWRESVEAYLATLKPPYGETGFLRMVEGEGFGSDGHLRADELPFRA